MAAPLLNAHAADDLAASGVTVTSCTIGSSDTRFGGRSLPLDVEPFGAPDCELHTDFSGVYPARFRAIGREREIARAGIDLPVPFDPRPAGARRFSRWAWVDRSGNALGLSFDNAVRMRIAINRPMLGIGWVECVDSGAVSGRVLVGRVPVLCLQL